MKFHIIRILSIFLYITSITTFYISNIVTYKLLSYVILIAYLCTTSKTIEIAEKILFILSEINILISSLIILFTSSQTYTINEILMTVCFYILTANCLVVCLCLIIYVILYAIGKELK